MPARARVRTLSARDGASQGTHMAQPVQWAYRLVSAADSHALVHLLDEQGAQGWEVVSVEVTADGDAHAYLKRLEAAEAGLTQEAHVN